MNSSSSQLTGGCFDPRTNAVLATYLRPEAKYHETAETIAEIHRLIWEHRKEIDPRLVYHRILGESEGNPYAVNPSSGAYGLFQWLGKPYRSSRTYRQILEELYQENPGVSPRLIQVKYYLEHYLQRFISAANEGYGCIRGKRFDQYTNLEKVTYLGWGSCSRSAMERETSLCRDTASYRELACPISERVITDNNPAPLCHLSASDFIGR